jgi:hypothetical protein
MFSELRQHVFTHTHAHTRTQEMLYSVSLILIAQHPATCELAHLLFQLVLMFCLFWFFLHLSIV